MVRVKVKVDGATNVHDLFNFLAEARSGAEIRLHVERGEAWLEVENEKNGGEADGRDV